FDLSLTFEMEVSYIWKAPWNMLKVLYIMSRYMPFIDVTAVVLSVCSRLLTCTWGFLHNTGVLGIFTLRTWAVWDGGKSLGIFLAVLFSTALLTVVVPFGLYLQSITYIASPVPHLFNCILQSPSILFSVSFAGAMVFDLTMLLLMTIRAVSSLRYGEKSDLMTVIYRDGIIYYAYAFGTSRLSRKILLEPPNLSAQSVPLSIFFTERVLHSVLSCRVVLHIREQNQQVVRVGAYEGVQLHK
ncbi:hypothetical protein P691DRAFT_679289, partial [Macrolepiota fuliginosa MF-IS2]